MPVVLMHGFPDSTHLYDRLVPHLAGRRPVVRFDFLGWAARTSRRATPTRPPTRAATWPPSSARSITSLAAASWCSWRTTPPARRRSTVALAHEDREASLVLLNTYYHWTASLRRPPAIALYSTPVIGAAARAVVRRRPDLDRCRRRREARRSQPRAMRSR